MPLILPHRITIRGHSFIPWLIRASCSCGWYALAPDTEKAQMAGDKHLSEEEPFPDLGLDANEAQT